MKIEILINRLWCRMVYGVKFQKGFDYKMIAYKNLHIMEVRHKLLLDAGWERISDLKTSLFGTYVVCFYRRSNSQ